MPTSIVKKMADDLKKNIQCNWLRLKDELSADSRVIADIALQNNILDFNAFEKIGTYPPVDKIDFILLRVVKLNMCELFLNVIEQHGFKQLCKKVRDTAIPIQPIQTSQTCVIGGQKEGTDPDMSVKEMWRKIEQKFEDERSSQIERDKRLEQRDKKLDQTLNEVHLKQNESQTQIEEMNLHFKTEFADLKSRYEKLQSAHQHARDEINRLTLSMKQKTSENVELSKWIKALTDSIELAKQTPTKDLEEKEKELENLRDKLQQETELTESYKTQIENLNSEKENITTQLFQTKSDLEQMRSKYDHLEAKLQSELAGILKKIDSLTSSHEATVAKQSKDAHTGTRPKNTPITTLKVQTASTPLRLGYKHLYQKRKLNVSRRK